MNRMEVRNEVVVLDYGHFENTNFSDCKIVYRGRVPPTLRNCEFFHCEWIFEDGALNTIAFLRALLGDEGMRPFVFEQVLGDQK